MNTHNLPKMFYSYREGWQDVIQVHPTVAKLFTTFVMPMSLIPPAMLLYSMLVTPGAVFPELAPPITVAEAIGAAVAFYLAELAMVALMASIIQQMGDVVDRTPDYSDAFLLAAIAPTPLWLSALALFVPVAWFSGVVVALAWVASAALIYHGVYPLFKLEDRSKARVMGSFVLTTGVIAWFALLVVLALAMSMIVGLRG
jgi:Yip1-like protein